MEPKIREDLILSEQEKDGTTHLVVKDPSTSKFFRFGGIEFFIIRHLDGGHSPEEVREKFQTEYDAPLPAETLHAFLGQLQTLGLLEGEAPIDRGRRQSPLYLRFKLIDPDRLLAWLLPRVRFFFTRPFLVLSAGLILVSVLLTAANQEEIALDLPRLFRFSSTFLIFLTVLVLASTHEFAHGLACKRYGGEVHEMGFMLLFFFPALYCNVSDTWLFPEKRKRMAVVFAGAYFELVLWAAGTVIWRLTPPDTIPHYVALLVMATLGLKTFFNLNPLLKLDGYYLLSDFLEIPNLRKKAGAYVKALLRGPFEARKEVSRRERRIFLVYGVLSGAYSIFILYFITTWVGGFLIGRYKGFGFVLFVGLLAFLFRKSFRDLVGKMFRLSPGEREERKVRKRIKMWAPLARLLKTGVPLAAVGAVLYFGHWDLRISSPFQVAPRSNDDIRAEVEGIIHKFFVKEGDRVNTGDLLVLLSPREYAIQSEKVEKQIAEKTARLKLLRAGPRREKIDVARQEMDTARTELFYRKRELEEGEQRRKGRLVKARVSLAKARTRVRFSRQYFVLKEKLFKSGLISRREYLEAQEQFQLREKESEEVREEVRLVESEKLMTLKSALALSEKRLIEAKRRLDLLLAGSRREEVEAVQAELARLKVELRHSQSREQLTRIVSPSAGIVTTPKLKEKVGEWAKKGDLILEVYDFSSVMAEMAVPEKEVADVKIGQEVVLKARSFPGRTFHGRVTSIAPVAQDKEVQRILTVRSEIANPDLLLRPGMSGSAKIIAGRLRVGQLILRRIARSVRVEFWSWY